MMNLKDTKDRLEAELKEAILAGDAENIIRLEQTLRETKTRIFADEAQNLRTLITSAQERKTKREDDLKGLAAIRGDRNRELDKALEVADEKRYEVRKVEFAMMTAQSGADLERENIREYKQQLNALLKEKLSEV